MKHRILALAITAMLVIMLFPAGAFAVSSPWSGASDTSWYNASDTSFSLMTAEQLAGLASLVNSGNNFNGKTVTLDDDIDLGDRQWTPIGIDFGHPFAGTFDGDGYAITGLAVGTSGSPAPFDYGGLFGCTSNISLIKNLSVQGSVFSGGNSAGVLVGLGEGDIAGCGTSGSVSSNFTSGGIAGRAYGSVTDSHSSATVAGGSDSGGLVGGYYPGNPMDILSGCYATGNVTVGDSANAGGLLGYFTSLIDIANCYATGDVTAGDGGCVGGFIGMNVNGTININDCFSTGDVTGGEYTCTGGFAGYLCDSSTYLERCYAAGDVTGGMYTGGLIGYCDAIVINCYASGSVTGDAGGYVGGLMGHNSCPVENSYARGAVSGGTGAAVGGFIGENNGAIDWCYFDMRGTGQAIGFGPGSAAETVTGVDTAQMTGTDAYTNMTDFYFSGIWEMKANDSKWYYPQLITFMGSSNPVIKAASLQSVTMTPFEVSFDVDGGSAVDSEYGYYTAVSEPAAPTWDSHIFGGWYTDDSFATAYDFSALVTADTTVYAKWTELTLESDDADGKIYVGGRVTLTPNIEEGEWDWDAEYLSATFNSPATFTGLKAGTTAITYTVSGVSVTYDVTIETSGLPNTGQDFTWVWVLLGAALILAAGTAVLKRKAAARER